MTDDRKDDERLDEGVEALMADRELPASLSPDLTALLQVAADLRDLPLATFKARLKSALHAAAAPAHGPVLLTAADIEGRLATLAAFSGSERLVAHDLGAALADLPELAMRFLAPLDRWTVVVSGYATDTPIWERHPAGDELLHVLEGGLDVTTLTATGLVHAIVPAGALFVCRRGLWHWARPRGHTSVLSLTPGEGTGHFQGTDPRGQRDLPLDVPPETPPEAGSRADLWDLPAARAGLEPVAITRDTTEAEANGAVHQLGWLEDRLVGVMRFSGETPWERHPDGDELLHVLDGEIDVTVLADAGPVHVSVAAGGVFVCPRGLWHRQRPKTAATLLFATPAATTEASWADDPRVERRE
ncbi:MAG: cupin domain-containing protein [Candidatus Binatia bacterium]